MGAPNQVWKGKLKLEGEKRGKIVVRTQPISGSSGNADVSWSFEWGPTYNRDPTTCMWWCMDDLPYYFFIDKQHPDNANDWFRVHS